MNKNKFLIHLKVILITFTVIINVLFILTSCSNNKGSAAYNLSKSASEQIRKLDSFICEVDCVTPSLNINSNNPSGKIIEQSTKTEIQYKRVNGLITFMENTKIDGNSDNYRYSDGKNDIFEINGKYQAKKIINPQNVAFIPSIPDIRFLKSENKYTSGGYIMVELVFDGRKMQNAVSGFDANNSENSLIAGNCKIAFKIDSSNRIVDYKIDSQMFLGSSKIECHLIANHHYSNFNGKVKFVIPEIT
jgi:hypothetical protein